MLGTFFSLHVMGKVGLADQYTRLKAFSACFSQSVCRVRSTRVTACVKMPGKKSHAQAFNLVNAQPQQTTRRHSKPRGSQLRPKISIRSSSHTGNFRLNRVQNVQGADERDAILHIVCNFLLAGECPAPDIPTCTLNCCHHKLTISPRATAALAAWA